MDELLAEPEPFLCWLFEDRPEWWVWYRDGLDQFVGDKSGAAAAGGPDIDISSDSAWLGLWEPLRAPEWMTRMDKVFGFLSRGAWRWPVHDGTEVLPPRWVRVWECSIGERLAVYLVYRGGAPAEDYRAGFWEGDLRDLTAGASTAYSAGRAGNGQCPADASPSPGRRWVIHCPPAAQFVFRGGLFGERDPTQGR